MIHTTEKVYLESGKGFDAIAGRFLIDVSRLTNGEYVTISYGGKAFGANSTEWSFFDDAVKAVGHAEVEVKLCIYGDTYTFTSLVQHRSGSKFIFDVMSKIEDVT